MTALLEHNQHKILSASNESASLSSFYPKYIQTFNSFDKLCPNAGSHTKFILLHKPKLIIPELY